MGGGGGLRRRRGEGRKGGWNEDWLNLEEKGFEEGINIKNTI